MMYGWYGNHVNYCVTSCGPHVTKVDHVIDSVNSSTIFTKGDMQHAHVHVITKLKTSIL